MIDPATAWRRPEEESTVKRAPQERRLTAEEADKYKKLRERVTEDLPDLLTREKERLASLDRLQDLLKQLKAAREAKGLSLSDLTERTGMDRSALSKLEIGQRGNPTVETLVRYARAVGKRLVVSLADA
jgi:DNA-binding phage protein